MYSGARYIVESHTDDTHAAPDAAFRPEKAQRLWGDLGVGSIHDLNPTPEQANSIQKWVIAHNRLGIPALFIEQVCTASILAPYFPPPSISPPHGTRRSHNRPAQPSPRRHAPPASQ